LRCCGAVHARLTCAAPILSRGGAAAAGGSGPDGCSAALRHLVRLGVLGGCSGAAADGSAWTTVLSKAGGATVRAEARACAHRGERVRVRGGVQFYGNADPQNKVTNEFAAPVLARYIVRYTARRGTRGLRGAKGLRRGTRGVLLSGPPRATTEPSKRVGGRRGQWASGRLREYNG
jgi:hypothetical protein